MGVTSAVGGAAKSGLAARQYDYFLRLHKDSTSCAGSPAEVYLLNPGKDGDDFEACWSTLLETSTTVSGPVTAYNAFLVTEYMSDFSSYKFQYATCPTAAAAKACDTNTCFAVGTTKTLKPDGCTAVGAHSISMVKHNSSLFLGVVVGVPVAILSVCLCLCICVCISNRSGKKKRREEMAAAAAKMAEEKKKKDEEAKKKKEEEEESEEEESDEENPGKVKATTNPLKSAAGTGTGTGRKA